MDSPGKPRNRPNLNRSVSSDAFFVQNTNGRTALGRVSAPVVADRDIAIGADPRDSPFSPITDDTTWIRTVLRTPPTCCGAIHAARARTPCAGMQSRPLLSKSELPQLCESVPAESNRASLPANQTTHQRSSNIGLGDVHRRSDQIRVNEFRKTDLRGMLRE